MVRTERLPFRLISSTLRRFNNPSLAIFIGRDGYLAGGIEWDAPGGKSGHLASKPGEPIKRYASGKFLRLDIEGALTPVPGTGEETLDGSLYSSQRFPRPCGSGSRSSS